MLVNKYVIVPNKMLFVLNIKQLPIYKLDSILNVNIYSTDNIDVIVDLNTQESWLFEETNDLEYNYGTFIIFYNKKIESKIESKMIKLVKKGDAECNYISLNCYSKKKENIITIILKDTHIVYKNILQNILKNLNFRKINKEYLGFINFNILIDDILNRYE